MFDSSILFVDVYHPYRLFLITIYGATGQHWVHKEPTYLDRQRGRVAFQKDFVLSDAVLVSIIIVPQNKYKNEGYCIFLKQRMTKQARRSLDAVRPRALRQCLLSP